MMRLRYLFAVVVLVTSIAVPLVSISTSGGARVESAVDAVTPANKARPALTTPELRNWRTTATVVAAGASLPLIASVFLVLAGIVGRYLRRIGDIGDDWRSLLEGAPPALP